MQTKTTMLAAWPVAALAALLWLPATTWGQEDTASEPPAEATEDIAEETGEEGAEETPSAAPQEIIEKYPEIKQAVELLRTAKFEECLAKLQEATEKYPELPPGRLVYAELLIKAKQTAMGRSELEKVAVEAADDPRVPLSMAAVALAEGRNADALLQIGKALELAENFEFAEEGAKGRFLAKAYLARSTVAERREEWQTAKDDLMMWLEQDPDSAAVRQRLGQASFFLGEVDEAREQLKLAKEKNENLSPPATALAGFHARKDEHEKAEELFKEGIANDASSPLAYYAYAQWLYNRQRVQEARELVVQGLESIPEAKNLRVLRAVLARHLKSFEEAEAELDDLLRESPNNFELRNELALALAEQQDGRKQQRAFQIAAQNFQAQRNNAKYVATLGWISYRLGRLEDAEKLITAAARMSGGRTQPDVLYYLAHVMAEKGKNDDVKKLLTKITDSEVPFAFREDASQWLERLNAAGP